MSLEEEVVIQRMNQGSDAKDMVAFVKALESTGLKVDRTKVIVAIRRYELLQRYNHQNEDLIKERVNAKIKKISKEYLEALMIDRSIVSARIEEDGRYGRRCECGEKRMHYNLIYEKIEKCGERLIKMGIKHEDVIKYCFNCGEIYSNFVPKKIIANNS